MVFSLWLWSRMKSMMTKNTCQTLAILKAMHIRWCNAGCIVRWSASVASCEATRCRHWASAHAVLPRRSPWSTISKRNTNKTQLLPSVLTADGQKKAIKSQPARDPLLTPSAQLAPTLTLVPLVKLKTLATFWPIKRSKWTKIWKVIKLERSLQKPVAHICASSSYPVNNIGEYVVFPAETVHQGFFSAVNKIVVQMQLFCGYSNSAELAGLTVQRHWRLAFRLEPWLCHLNCQVLC